eukprot:TRINITY_DN6874_c0_g1_i3.p1 TRINITY_DN6874_c0_g1~~TRINITY_DN6874_c0_g1_i3.p1  ORF type:complete len:149 (-),score=28.69 TRINITY_DN6874_c0_g1_i3:164-610(-)
MDPIQEYKHPSTRSQTRMSNVSNSLLDLPCGAFADDIEITTDNFDEMKKAVQMVQNYCDEFQMQMNCGSNDADTSKTAYTFLEPSRSYRYLGVHINLYPLKYRCFTVTQTVEAINKIFIPAIEYRLAVIEADDKWLKMMDNMIAVQKL